MTELTSVAAHQLDDLVVHYLQDGAGRVTLRVLPASLPAGQPRRDVPAAPLVQVALAGDPQPSGFAAGRTMLGAPAGDRLRLIGQRLDGRTIVTELSDGQRLTATHRLTPVTGPDGTAVAVTTTVTNIADRPLVLELLTSATLAGLTTYAPDDGPERLWVHRFRSSWADEGRLVSDRLERLGLERSPSRTAVSERFGQVGNLPVRGWFPTVVVEDAIAGVCWGMRLGWAGSWQLELSRLGDDLTISAGLADREFGHWRHTLQPGESLEAPPAWITCTASGLDDACARMLVPDQVALDQQLRTSPARAAEQDLPVVFNEWCSSWGEPHHDVLLQQADRVAGLGARYLVIDAGWYRPSLDPQLPWSSTHGDWQPNSTLFPDGLAATAAAIRERGLVPGLWFEVETVGANSTAFTLTDHLLHREGVPITIGDRRFWDLADPWVVDHLAERVIGLLRATGMGYLKVDHNESIGLGADHSDGLGAGLRRQVLGTHALFDRITRELPDLVIENCASGGHRLEASMLHRTAMSSFSDAHENREIPIIAAALHRLVLPRQSQIWAVLHRDDDADRLVYSLAAGFLGRLCLSGEVADLTEDQVATVRRAIDRYGDAAAVIRDGRSRILDHTGMSRRHPVGWQAVLRRSGDRMLVVAHAFAGAPGELVIDLDDAGWQLVDVLTHRWRTELNGSQLTATGVTPFSATVALLRRA